MSTISLVHEGGNISIEHLASMSATALAVQEIIKAKGSKRYANQGREGRSKSWSNFHRNCQDSYCCPKGRKPHRPTQHELKLVALWDDFGGVYPFRVTVPQSAPQAMDMLLGKEMSTPKAMPSPAARSGFNGGYSATPGEIRSMQREAIAEGRWFPETAIDDDPDINPFARQDMQERAAAYRAKLDRQNAQRKAAEQRRAAARLEANRQHWAKVYQRPEAEQAAKRSLSNHAVLSTATK